MRSCLAQSRLQKLSSACLEHLELEVLAQFGSGPTEGQDSVPYIIHTLYQLCISAVQHGASLFHS